MFPACDDVHIIFLISCGFDTTIDYEIDFVPFFGIEEDYILGIEHEMCNFVKS